MPVLLIRHVQAGDRKEWHGDDSARPLSAKGRRQAEGLARMLEGYGVQRVLSSPYARCVQTVTP
ncbi:MAG: SixA phosphatase family protein, partial [Acidimicrobiales bacterium]